MTTPTQDGHGVADPGHSSKNDTPTDSKKPTVSTKTYIFDLTLGESNEETYPEFSWTELIKGAKAKEKHSKSKPGATVLDPYASDDEEDLKAMAARFEQKYSSKTPAKSKKRKVEDYLDKGAGYDDNDSFIDNTDVYDEFVPPEVQTAHGGFYINSGSLEFKDVVMSDDEDTREKKAKANRKSAFPKPPYPKQTEEQKQTQVESNTDSQVSQAASIINNKPNLSSELGKKEGLEISRIKTPSNSIKHQGPNPSNSNPNKTKEADTVSIDKSTLPNSSLKNHEKVGAPPVKKVPRIIESSSSSLSSSSDDSSTSSDSDSTSSEEEEDNQVEDTEKTKDKVKQKEVVKELSKSAVDDKMPVLTPQTQPKVMPPLPALNPAPPQKRLKTKNVPPNPNLHKNKPPLTSSPNVTPAVNKITPIKNKDIFLGNNNVRAVSPNTNSVSGLTLPEIRRNQSPNSMNLSYVGGTPASTSAATIIKIPTPKSTPTPTSSPLGLGTPIYTSANTANQQLKPSLPLNLLKPKPKPRVKKMIPGSQGATLTAEDIFNTLQGLNSLTNAGLLSQATGSNNFVNKPVAKARLSKLTASSSNNNLKGIMNSKKAQRLNPGQLSQKSLKLKSKHGMSSLTNSVPISSTSSAAAAAMLAFNNSTANQIASLTSLSSFRPSPLTSAVEITKLRPAHMSSTSSASTTPNPYKSLTQQLGTGITVTEVGDKIRSSGSTSAPPIAIPSSSGTFTSSSSSNNIVQTSNANNISAMNTIGNSVSSANSLSMNRILQAITITPSPLLNLTSTSGGNDRPSASSNLNTFSSTSRGFSSSSSLQKPLKHITPYDVNALLGKMDPHVATSLANSNANNATKASIEKIRLGNGINPREHQKK